MNRVVIAAQENITFVSLLDANNRLLECHPFDNSFSSSVGDIYNGIIKNKIKGINGYFVDYGAGKDGYLPIDKSNNKLSPGQTIVIQVEKEAYEQKGAKITTNISFSGEYAVLVSDSTSIHFSSKLPDDERTKELKLLFSVYANDSYGFIVRTNAYDGDNLNIVEEVNRLIASYDRVKQIHTYRGNKACLYSPNESWLRIVQNMNKSLLDRIIVATEDMKNQITDYLLEIGLHNNITVILNADIFRIEDMASRLKKACQRKVWLASGASIIIDKTEAMYVIDVNSNKNISKRAADKNLFKINMEAAKEIVYQIRLRNMSGIILVDFIDMNNEEDRQKLLDLLAQQFTFDPVKAIVHGLTHLGIVEISRKRIEKSLCDKLSEYTTKTSLTL